MKHLSLLVLSFVILFGCNNINELTQTDALSQNNKQKSSQNFPISEEEMLCKEKMIFFAILVFFETKKESPEGLPFPLLSNTIILV